MVFNPSKLPELGQRLKRQRQLRGIKQSHLAELMGVDQTTISRWESGAIAFETAQAKRAFDYLRSAPDDDGVLRRLVTSSCLPIHLITDNDHRLLAASTPRKIQWGHSSDRWDGQSLWPFATPEIVTAEEGLDAAGWWDEELPKATQIMTSAGGGPDIRIAAGILVWERVWLSDGTPGRLCTSETNA